MQGKRYFVSSRSSLSTDCQEEDSGKKRIFGISEVGLEDVEVMTLITSEAEFRFNRKA